LKTKKKLKIFAKKKFGSVTALADAMGISQPSIAQYTSGKRGIGNKQIERLRDLGCDINWLMSEDDEPMPEGLTYIAGDGKTYTTTISNTKRMIREVQGRRIEEWIKKIYGGSTTDAAKRIGISEPLLNEYISGRKSAIEIWDKLQKAGFDMLYMEEGRLTQIMSTTRPVPEGSYYYPIVNKVQGGIPSLLYREDNITDLRFSSYKKERNCFFVVVEGDSMDGGDRPIRDGDFALVDMDIPVMSGDLVVVSVAGRQMIKQFIKNNGAMSLRSYKSDKYNDIPIRESEIEVMYRVVKIASEYST